MATIEWLGHSSFRIQMNGTTFITDPAYQHDPNAPVEPSEVDDADFVLVGHGHFDHAADAVEVADASDASIVAVAELAVKLEQQRESVEAIMRNPSAPLDLGTGVEVGLIEMDHSNSLGLAEGAPSEAGMTCGFVLRDDEQTVFFADDTGICANLQVVGDVYNPDISLLPISGGFVMDPAEAAIAADWTNADTVIPMHYDSIDAIPSVNPEAFANAVSDRTPETTVEVLEQGETVDL